MLEQTPLGWLSVQRALHCPELLAARLYGRARSAKCCLVVCGEYLEGVAVQGTKFAIVVFVTMQTMMMTPKLAVVVVALVEFLAGVQGGYDGRL